MTSLTDEQSRELVRHQKLARWYAIRARRRVPSLRKMPFEDCYQQALLGIAEAIRRYDPARAKLTTYAQWHMRAAMQDLLRHQGIVSIPRGILHSGSGISDETRAQARTALEGAAGAIETQYDLIATDSRDPLADLDAVEYAMKPLTDREREVVWLRVEGLSMSEIGRRYGVSTERVREILAKSMGLMRARLEVAR